MRYAATLIHRWAGLFVALFLIVSGLTGAVISWDHEIDEWLNSDLYKVESRGEFHSPIELATLIERRDPRAQVVYIPLHFEEGHSAGYLVQPRIDPDTGKPAALDYTHVFIDPVTAEIVGTRDAGKASLSPRNLMPFLRELHESLHMPAAWGSDRWGYRLMGVIAL
ncbi:MAG TPA: PepSY-associated TM helix domain-containing protein, partial [Burkholderiaceae bacterium]|nr:PepSY-associated TM helix domain-containing protein [Burkholderiaceae bacterium]